MEDKKWEFECPQVFDFNNIDKYDIDIDSYFDKKIETEKKDTKNEISLHKEGNNNEEKAKENRRVFRFTAGSSLPLKPVVKDEEKDKNIFAAHSKPNVQRKTLRDSFGKSHNAKRPSVATAMRRVPFMVPKLAVKLSEVSLVKEQPENKLLSETTQQENKLPPASSTSIPRRQLTRPTTPECLKRSLNKVKTVKSSEELELERIAEMRRKLKTQIQVNKATMEKARAPALRPLVLERARSPVPSSQRTRLGMPISNSQTLVACEPTASTRANVNNDKEKGKIEFKKPADVPRIKSAIGFFSQKRENSFNNLHQERRHSRSVDSCLSNFSSLDSSVQGKSRIKSLNVCHSGIKFIPKQPGSAKKKTNLFNQENKELSKSPKKVNLKETFLKLKRDIPKTKPFQDKTNHGQDSKFLEPKRTYLPFSKNKGLKRKSVVSLIELKHDKKNKF